MRLFFAQKWVVSLILSLFFIVIGALVRCDKLSINSFKQKIVETSNSSVIDINKPSQSSIKPIKNNEIEISVPREQENTNIQSESPIPRLKDEMAKKLVEKGFSSYESDQAIQTIVSTFQENESGEVDSISLAIERTSNLLNLDVARKAQLRLALFESFNETGGAFTVDEFRICIEKRTKILAINDCGINLLNRFSEELIASAIGNEKITLKMQTDYSVLRDRYVTLSKSCNIDSSIAERLFAPMLSDCPN